MTRNWTEGFEESPTIRQENITLSVNSEHLTDRTPPSLRAARRGQYRRHAHRR